LHLHSSRQPILHKLSSGEVSGDFCDLNSPLSLAGYFGGEQTYNNRIGNILTFDLTHSRTIKVKGSQFDIAEDKHYFYWFFEKRTTSLQQNSSGDTGEDEPIPFVVWLNGGPGCSSLLGLLTENGPCLVNSDGSGTTPNPNSWNEVAHVLYLDQPAKTGYSFGATNDSTESMVAEDAFYLLQAFFQSELGEKYQQNPLYLTGESYAGHYIPTIAHRILQGNMQEDANLINLPLAGVAIGNPWIDPETQFEWYAAMASENSHGLKIFTDEEIQTMKELTPACIDSVRKCNTDNSVDEQLNCQIANVFCNNINMDPLNSHNISPYDITKAMSTS
jgi:cathepsin A (carboxypeptidase C)